MEERIPPSVKALLAERGAASPGLAGRVVEVVDAWDLRVIDMLEGGWNSFAALTAAAEGVVVLKLTAQPAAMSKEVVALTWWGEEIAPRVLRHDERFGLC